MNELRKDPILGRWVIISTERSRRPDSFASPQVVTKEKAAICPFCMGNEKMTPPEIWALRPDKSKRDTPGWKVRVVANKFPALGIDGELIRRGVGMFDMISGFGAHEVIIETPDHDKNLKDQSSEELGEVLKTFQYRIADLHKDKRLRYVLVFKNEGREAGASLEHPHSQLIATPATPKRVKEELVGSKNYFEAKERCIYCDILAQEMDSGERIVYENREYVSFCPFASRFPFEIWLLPKKHSPDFCCPTTQKNIPSLAEALKTTMQKLARVLNNPSYNYLIHTAPNRAPRADYWQTIDQDFHWHFEIMPHLVRVAGFEWGTGFYINPTAPEEAAKYLREARV
ncbi:galactose-1-phosphate uridylyltransferase [bacterium]|nr:galactose-1-phosphate uridylyltransferase [bacterium]